MPKYPVLEPLHHDGIPYGPGGTVEMETKEASHLLKLGVLGPAAKTDTPAAKAKTDADAKADAAGQGGSDPKKPAAEAAKPDKEKK
jgi:hypothetical protein